MTGYRFSLCTATLEARASGALWWPDKGILCVSDLHLGKSERLARRGGPLLPPYDSRRTLDRLTAEIDTLAPTRLISLGDSFDDDLAELPPADARRLEALKRRCDWNWIEGNHDPAPTGLDARPQAQLTLPPLTFRHIATPEAPGEVSGHYHPKHAAPGGRARPCFLTDGTRLILPAFGSYTGGLNAHDAAFSQLFSGTVTAILTGHRALPLPLLTPRPTARRMRP